MLKKKKKRDTGEINAGAMSDIAFLLLIFFIVTTIFALEQGIPLVLPGEKSKSVKMKRKNLLIVQANPNGTILSAAMMFEYAFQLKEEAETIKKAVIASLSEGIVTEDIAENVKPSSTSEVGDWIAGQI